MCAELRARPDDEPPALALRHALSVFTSLCDADPDKPLHMSRLILNTPALLARFLERQSQCQAEMADILARRTGAEPDADLRPPSPPASPSPRSRPRCAAGWTATAPRPWTSWSTRLSR
ncbi:hypothetical protein ABTZ93_04130 [Streptomyces sp. NPDC097941]|uniref:acyl-CoA-like ligand-binding transcription factor n=1 Tax=Streptomyces sp. NPDC097941 TaxID=3155685 RepID=UPI003326B7D7